MISRSNCFGDLIGAFKIVCSSLEKKAEQNLKKIEEEYGEEFVSNVKSLQKFDEMVSGINKTCSEMVNNSEILKSAAERNLSENFINLPYEIHADVIECINKLYNMTPDEKICSEEKLIDQKNKELVHDWIKSSEKNVRDIKDIENTITEAKEIFQCRKSNKKKHSETNLLVSPNEVSF